MPTYDCQFLFGARARAQRPQEAAPRVTVGAITVVPVTMHERAPLNDGLEEARRVRVHFGRELPVTDFVALTEARVSAGAADAREQEDSAVQLSGQAFDGSSEVRGAKRKGCDVGEHELVRC